MPAHLAAGTTLGRYKILSQLGAGGMGEVYLAEDAKLHRKIALKILPEDVATNRDRMRRFEQEATAAAALNHPNIAHIYEIGKERSSPTFSADQAEVHFISMEYIDGYTLRECIYQKHVELRKLLRYLQHVAEGLAKAHASGIVHRDLKPDNLMVTREGYAKILDFGLAKLVEQPDMSSVTASSQVSTALQPKHSVPGTVMGTVGYMSPEQAQGKVNEIDHRSDIFSFGCILFEAITKHRPFEAESTIKSLHKVVYEHPPLIKDFNPEAPPDLQRIVRRCLAKDPEERYQTIKDVALEIKEVRHEIDEAASIHATDTPALSTEKSVNANSSNQTASIIGTTQRSVSSVEYLVTGVKRHKAGALLGLVLGALALAALAYGLYVWWRRPEAMRKSAALKIAPFTSFPGTKGAPAFSWDGKQIAFVWSGEKDDNADIYVKLIGEGSPLRLTTDPLPDITPAWSPDGIHIAFIRVAPGERALFTIPRLGGAERRLFSSPELRQPDWSPDGKYLAVADSESAGDLTSIYLVSPESGVRKRLTQTPAQFNGDTNPKFSPNGEWVAFIRSTNFAVEDVYIVPVSGGEPRRLTNDGHQLAGLAWTADSREIVFSSSRGGSYGLWRVSTDGGPPEAVPGAGDNAQEPAISRQGNYLAYLFDGSDTNIWRAPGPNAKDRTIAPIKLVESTRNDGSPRYSPDGKKIAFASDRTGGTEVWVCDSEGHNSVQLTKFGGHAGAPRWSPDGKQILLDARPEGSSDIYVVGAEGGSPRRLTDQPSADILPEWSRDGRWIYFGSDRSGEWRLWRMPAAGGPAEQITKDLAYGPVAVDDQFIYYARSGGVSARRANQPGIWRVPLSGGEEVRVVDQGRAGNVSVIREGIAIFTNDSQPNPTIDFFSFAAGKWTNLLSIDRVNAVSFAGRISVSPDGQWVVYSRRDQMVKDIMLVENFR